MPAPVRQEVHSLPLPPSLRQKLLYCGFTSAADLQNIGPVDLSREAQITPEEALLALKVVSSRFLQGGGIKGAQSAQQIYEKEAAARKIITFCSELDNILGGGVATGQVTEFCGVPAVGKTQLGIQLATDVQIPQSLGGLGGAAVYIDTEGSFMVERVVEIMDAALRHLRKIAAHKGPDLQQEAEALTRERMLRNIHYYRVRDYVEQLAAVQLLPDLLQRHPEIRLVVMDSVTFHFRQDISDMSQRTRILSNMAQQLMQLAGSRDVAVILMNQVTTKISEGAESRLVPALGDSWAHAATSRVMLYWEEQRRCALLYKSPSLPARTAEYFITADGVRGRRPSKRPRQLNQHEQMGQQQMQQQQQQPYLQPHPQQYQQPHQ